MSITEHERTLLRHEEQIQKIRARIVQQVEKVKEQAFIAREEMIRKRAEKIDHVRGKLNETTRKIQVRHDLIRIQLNQDAIHREVSLRVNRGLETLERFIQILLDSNVGTETIEKIFYDPLTLGETKTEMRKTLTLDFFKSVQKQAIMQTDFINIAAHELRTPIMPILVNIEILEEQIGKDTPELKIIARNAKRLLRLTENILSVAKIESNSLKLNKERFELNTLLLEIIHDLIAHIENDNVKIVHETKSDKIYVEADKDKINQVVFNLLHNALKFTKKGTILVTSEVRENDVLISIKDNGDGIDIQIFSILFTKFAAKSEKGTGLGLFISKSIIDAHGGSIWATNNIRYGDKGATFQFTLPISK